MKKVYTEKMLVFCNPYGFLARHSRWCVQLFLKRPAVFHRQQRGAGRCQYLSCRRGFDGLQRYCRKNCPSAQPNAPDDRRRGAASRCDSPAFWQLNPFTVLLLSAASSFVGVFINNPVTTTLYTVFDHFPESLSYKREVLSVSECYKDLGRISGIALIMLSRRASSGRSSAFAFWLPHSLSQFCLRA